MYAALVSVPAHPQNPHLRSSAVVTRTSPGSLFVAAGDTRTDISADQPKGRTRRVVSSGELAITRQKPSFDFAYFEAEVLDCVTDESVPDLHSSEDSARFPFGHTP